MKKDTKLYKLWDLESGATLNINGQAFKFTTMDGLIKVFETYGTKYMTSIIEGATFVNTGTNTYEMLPFPKRSI